MKGINRRTLIKLTGVTGGLSLLSALLSNSSYGSGKRAPSIFIGHGNPLNTVTDNTFRREWDRIANVLAELNTPKAILCISAHWESKQPLISTTERSDLIYDFYGFPDEMYQLKYPAPGFTESRKLLVAAAPDTAFSIDPRRGLDHGAWCVLSRLFPKADVPVFQLSLSRSFSASAHYALAKQLGKLRDLGVLIIGSGNITHNMRSRQYDSARGQMHITHDWAKHFDTIVANAVNRGDHTTLIRAAQEKPSLFRVAHPTPEHYLPLLYTLGAQHKEDNIEFFAEGFARGSFSMRSILMT
jgi:4,5-DOPA dioxygenase extradiol